jgi:hypothetical protein
MTILTTEHREAAESRRARSGRENGHDEQAVEMPGIRARLSTMWMFIMFNMVFADILSFMYPGALNEVLTGHAGGIHITPAFLLGAAIVTEIPIAMIVLSRVLRRGVNRWANVVAGMITIAYVVGGGPLTQLHYIFFAAMEVACALLIVGMAWKWRDPQTSTTPAVVVGAAR